MERDLTFEKFISSWNGVFPNYLLKLADLKSPQVVIGALVLLFDRLGIDRDAVLSVSTEETINESMMYYRDLLPVINLTRVINHLVSTISPMESITIMFFLQPTIDMSHSTLLLLFNWTVFNEQRLGDISLHEAELVAKTDQVKALEDRKIKLLEMLNKQAEEKGKRAGRLEKLNAEIKQLEEELKQETDVHEKEKQESDAILKENEQLEVLLEQKKRHRDALLEEVARKKASRVYDADEIRAKAEQAAQNIQEAEERGNSLRATLMQKENSIKNLQTIKPSLDTANNLLHEIMKLSDSLKDFECSELDIDKEDELDILNIELAELQAQLQELKTMRTETTERRQESCAKRQHERNVMQSALREAEEKDRKSRERCKKALQRIDEIKEQTLRYEAEKSAGMEEIFIIENKFKNELRTVEETLMKKMIETEKKVEEKLRHRNM